MPNIEIELDSLDIDVTVLVGDKEHHFNAKEELIIDKFDINGGYIDQPGKYAWWGTLTEVAREKMENAKAEMEQEEFHADIRAREELDLDGIKITEGLVTRKVKCDREYKKKQSRYIKATKQFKLLDKIMKAFDHRMEALISLGAMVRKENDNVELTMKKEMAKKIIKKNN
ncbi:hypothetical protein [Bacillus paranthracis]|uniref:hypothetical protein n=1 Tax=Bacillus paranthracis TaxID=2026186 RepID=UPI0022E84B3D|nr:hypothetical protein [Bacillus paranthracis]